MTRYDGWEPIGERLGKGGQGTVYRARSPEWVKWREQAAIEVTQLLRQVSHAGTEISVSELAQKVVEVGSPDPLEHLGALKQFAIPADDKKEEAEAVGRLISEVQALQKVKHPAVLKLLHSNIDERFIVTEYHQRGTLDEI